MCEENEVIGSARSASTVFPNWGDGANKLAPTVEGCCAKAAPALKPIARRRNGKRLARTISGFRACNVDMGLRSRTMKPAELLWSVHAVPSRYVDFLRSTSTSEHADRQAGQGSALRHTPGDGSRRLWHRPLEPLPFFPDRSICPWASLRTPLKVS